MDYAIFNVGYTFRKNALNFSNFVTKFKYRRDIHNTNSKISKKNKK